MIGQMAHSVSPFRLEGGSYLLIRRPVLTLAATDLHSVPDVFKRDIAAYGGWRYCRTTGTGLSADAVVIAAGAWSGRLAHGQGGSRVGAGSRAGAMTLAHAQNPDGFAQGPRFGSNGAGGLEGADPAGAVYAWELRKCSMHSEVIGCSVSARHTSQVGQRWQIQHRWYRSVLRRCSSGNWSRW